MLKLKYLSEIQKITVLVVSVFCLESSQLVAEACLRDLFMHRREFMLEPMNLNSREALEFNREMGPYIPSSSDLHSSRPQSDLNFDASDRFRRVLIQGRVQVFAPAHTSLDSATEERVRLLSDRLNETFSTADHCPVCMAGWEELNSSNSSQVVLVTGNCDCHYFFCEPCSEALDRQHPRCPSCRSGLVGQRLYFVVDLSDEVSMSQPAGS